MFKKDLMCFNMDNAGVTFDYTIWSLCWIFMRFHHFKILGKNKLMSKNPVNLVGR